MTAKLSRDEIELELFSRIANLPWHDVTHENVIEFDSPISKAYIGAHKRLPQMYMVVQWSDGKVAAACLSDRHPGEWRSITSESYKAEWLLEVIEGRRPTENPT